MIKIFYNIYDILEKKQKKKFQFLFILSIFAVLLETMSVVSVMPLVSSLVTSPNFLIDNFLKNMEFTNNYNLILITSLTVALAFTFKAIFLIYYTKIKFFFIEKVKVDQSNSLFFYYLNQPFTFHVHNNSSKLIRNLNESQSLATIVKLTVETMLEILVIIGLTFFLFYLQPKLTSLCLIILGIFSFLFNIFINKNVKKWGELRQKFAGLKLKELQQGFGSIRDIKIHNKQNFFLNSFSDKNFNESEYNYRNSFISSLPRILFEWITIASTLGILFYASLNNSVENFLPILAAFALAAYRIIPSITRILQANQSLKYMFPIMKPYIKQNKSQDTNKKQIKNVNSIKKNVKQFKDNFNEIKFIDLSFKFDNSDNYILKNINFSIKKNDFIGIYGKSGTGKTTLVNLILGLYKPSEGNILCGSKEIFSDIYSWRKLLSFIPQNVYIIDDTIKNNIAYGDNKKLQDNKKIISSLEKSNALEFVNNLKDSLDTKCGEFGEFFSGGQRQRLAIARAFYNDADIYIFDEFTNFLDEKNESEIINEISKMNNKTRIIVSHNQKVLNRCKRVFEIENQSIIEK